MQTTLFHFIILTGKQLFVCFSELVYFIAYIYNSAVNFKFVCIQLLQQGKFQNLLLFRFADLFYIENFIIFF